MDSLTLSAGASWLHRVQGCWAACLFFTLTLRSPRHRDVEEAQKSRCLLSTMTNHHPPPRTHITALTRVNSHVNRMQWSSSWHPCIQHDREKKPEHTVVFVDQQASVEVEVLVRVNRNANPSNVRLQRKRPPTYGTQHDLAMDTSFLPLNLQAPAGREDGHMAV